MDDMYSGLPIDINPSRVYCAGIDWDEDEDPDIYEDPGGDEPDEDEDEDEDDF